MTTEQAIKKIVDRIAAIGDPKQKKSAVKKLLKGVDKRSDLGERVWAIFGPKEE